jgi:inorganic pyrophosphatase
MTAKNSKKSKHVCCLTQDEEKTPIKQDIKKGKLRFYPYNINWWGPSAAR